MTGQANTFEVENPYTYWRAAHESEQGGDIRGADMGYKAAVMAADNLPLNEYRRNFYEELAKHQSVPGYRTPPNIGIDELKQAYAELLTLPFVARVRLANFLARQSQTGEALEMCDSALKLKIDDWIHDQQLYLEYRQQLDNIVMNLQYGARRPTQTGKQLSIGQQLLKKQPQQQPATQSRQAQSLSYSNMPDISELWEQHKKSTKVMPARADALSGGAPASAQSSTSGTGSAAAGTSAAPASAFEPEAPLAVPAVALIDSMQACLKRFSDDLAGDERKRLSVSVSQPEWVDEPRRPGILPAPGVATKYYRFRASTALWSLSVRGTDGSVEVFAVPARDALQLSAVESDDNILLKYSLAAASHGRQAWMHDNYPLYADDVRVALRNAFKDLLGSSSEFFNSKLLSTAGAGGLAKQVSELSQQTTNLAEKIVYQQEMVQNRIARDIHDGVIADLLALKRAYEAQAATDQQVVETLEDVCQRLRNICSDLAPRDLQDWGLRTVVTDMAGSVATRSKMRAHINVAAELPEIPQQVSLHIYRIIQECLNNMEKHSRASEFRVDLGASDGILLVDVADNGVGFDTGASDKRKAAQGGMGLDSIRERVELIRCFYPAQLWIQSKPGAGAKVTVQINLNRGA